MRIFFDASFNQNPGKSGSGFLVRSPKGEVLATKGTIHNYVASPFATEALACLDATRFGSDLDFRRTSILGDGRSVITKCRSEEIDRSEIRAIIHRIKVQRQRFQSIHFIHISRDFNSDAHNLATSSLKRDQKTYLVYDAPERNQQNQVQRRPREPD